MLKLSAEVLGLRSCITKPIAGHKTSGHDKQSQKNGDKKTLHRKKSRFFLNQERLTRIDRRKHMYVPLTLHILSQLIAMLRNVA